MEAATRSKRTQDVMYNDEYVSSAGFSSPQQVTQRRRVKIATEITTSSPGHTLATTKIRKNVRYRRYYENMAHLNAKFAAWAKEEEEKICQQIENGELTVGTMTTFYFDNVSKYIQTAQEIRKRFYPATRDVLTFGQDESGQLGHPYKGRNLDCNHPKCVMLFRTAAIDEIECGGMHSIAVSVDGKVFTFGSNDEGQLGNVDLPPDSGYTPTEVHGFIPSSLEVAQGLTKVLTWRDVVQDLGNQLNDDPKHKLDPKYQEDIVAVAAGDSHSLCLSSTGRVYFFGAYKDIDNKKFKDDTPKDDPRKHKPLTEEERKARESSYDDDDYDDGNDDDEEDRKRRDEVVGTEEEARSVPEKAPVGTQEWPIHINTIDGEVVKIAAGGSLNAFIVAKTDQKTGITSKSCWTWGIMESGQLSREVSKPIINPHHVETPDESKLARYKLDVIHEEHLVPRPVQWDVGNGNDRKV